MSGMLWLGAVAAIALLVYLVAALLLPEKFS
jgi:K+-transporting ATPase KdpF subunit